MNNKVLGIVGMIAAPFLYIDFELHGDNHLTGLFEFIYMTINRSIGVKNRFFVSIAIFFRNACLVQICNLKLS